MITIANEKRTEEPLDLKIPNKVQRITFFPNATSMPADGKTKYTMRTFVSTPSGNPDTNANIIFKSELGEFSTVTNEGDGIYSVEYTPPFSNTKTSTNIQAVLQSVTGDSIDSFSLELIPAMPDQLLIKSEVSVLLKNAKSFNILTGMKDPNNKGMPNRGISFAANGAKIVQTKELGNGDYTTKFSPTSNGPVEITAVVKGSTSNNPPHNILMIPSQSRLANDGLSSSLLTFIVYDRFGYPISNQPLSLEIVTGNGSVPSQVTTNASGVGQVTYCLLYTSPSPRDS